MGQVARGAENDEDARWRRPLLGGRDNFAVARGDRNVERHGLQSDSAGGHWRRAHAGFLAVDAHRVAAELVAQRGEHAPRERVAIARIEAAEQRHGDDRRRHVLVDGGLDRPAAFARIVDPALEAVELGVLLERVDGQVEQPRAHHAAVLPDLADLLQVERVLGLLEHLEALGVRLHHAVLDAVVDHLDEVAGAVRADQAVAVLGRQRLHGWLDAREGFG